MQVIQCSAYQLIMLNLDWAIKPRHDPALHCGEHFKESAKMYPLSKKENFLGIFFAFSGFILEVERAQFYQA